MGVDVKQGQPAGGQPAGDLLSDDELASNPGSGMDDQRTCLGETRAVEVIGLDIFVMLDISGSMLDVLPTASLRARQQTTKWDAVKQSMEAFVQAPESAEIGVGMQYFPKQQPGVPDSCISNAE